MRSLSIMIIGSAMIMIMMIEVGAKPATNAVDTAETIKEDLLKLITDVKVSYNYL